MRINPLALTLLVASGSGGAGGFFHSINFIRNEKATLSNSNKNTLRVPPTWVKQQLTVLHGEKYNSENLSPRAKEALEALKEAEFRKQFLLKELQQAEERTNYLKQKLDAEAQVLKFNPVTTIGVPVVAAAAGRMYLESRKEVKAEKNPNPLDGVFDTNVGKAGLATGAASAAAALYIAGSTGPLSTATSQQELLAKIAGLQGNSVERVVEKMPEYDLTIANTSKEAVKANDSTSMSSLIMAKKIDSNVETFDKKTEADSTVVAEIKKPVALDSDSVKNSDLTGSSETKKETEPAAVAAEVKKLDIGINEDMNMERPNVVISATDDKAEGNAAKVDANVVEPTSTLLKVNEVDSSINEEVKKSAAAMKEATRSNTDTAAVETKQTSNIMEVKEKEPPSLSKSVGLLAELKKKSTSSEVNVPNSLEIKDEQTGESNLSKSSSVPVASTDGGNKVLKLEATETKNEKIVPTNKDTDSASAVVNEDESADRTLSKSVVPKVQPEAAPEFKQDLDELPVESSSEITVDLAAIDAESSMIVVSQEKNSVTGNDPKVLLDSNTGATASVSELSKKEEPSQMKSSGDASSESSAEPNDTSPKVEISKNTVVAESQKQVAPIKSDSSLLNRANSVASGEGSSPEVTQSEMTNASVEKATLGESQRTAPTSTEMKIALNREVDKLEDDSSVNTKEESAPVVTAESKTNDLSSSTENNNVPLLQVDTSSEKFIAKLDSTDDLSAREIVTAQVARVENVETPQEFSEKTASVVAENSNKLKVAKVAGASKSTDIVQSFRAMRTANTGSIDKTVVEVKKMADDFAIRLTDLVQTGGPEAKRLAEDFRHKVTEFVKVKGPVAQQFAEESRMKLTEILNIYGPEAQKFAYDMSQRIPEMFRQASITEADIILQDVAEKVKLLVNEAQIPEADKLIDDIKQKTTALFDKAMLPDTTDFSKYFNDSNVQAMAAIGGAGAIVTAGAVGFSKLGNTGENFYESDPNVESSGAKSNTIDPTLEEYMQQPKSLSKSVPYAQSVPDAGAIPASSEFADNPYAAYAGTANNPSAIPRATQFAPSASPEPVQVASAPIPFKASEAKKMEDPAKYVVAVAPSPSPSYRPKSKTPTPTAIMATPRESEDDIFTTSGSNFISSSFAALFKNASPSEFMAIPSPSPAARSLESETTKTESSMDYSSSNVSGEEITFDYVDKVTGKPRKGVEKSRSEPSSFFEEYMKDKGGPTPFEAPPAPKPVPIMPPTPSPVGSRSASTPFFEEYMKSKGEQASSESADWKSSTVKPTPNPAAAEFSDNPYAAYAGTANNPSGEPRSGDKPPSAPRPMITDRRTQKPFKSMDDSESTKSISSEPIVTESSNTLTPGSSDFAGNPYAAYAGTANNPSKAPRSRDEPPSVPLTKKSPEMMVKQTRSMPSVDEDYIRKQLRTELERNEMMKNRIRDLEALIADSSARERELKLELDDTMATHQYQLRALRAAAAKSPEMDSTLERLRKKKLESSSSDETSKYLPNSGVNGPSFSSLLMSEMGTSQPSPSSYNAPASNEMDQVLASLRSKNTRTDGFNGTADFSWGTERVGATSRSPPPVPMEINRNRKPVRSEAMDRVLANLRSKNTRTDNFEGSASFDWGTARVGVGYNSELGNSENPGMLNSSNTLGSLKDRQAAFLCDVCGAAFSTYPEAAAHEMNCMANRNRGILANTNAVYDDNPYAAYAGAYNGGDAPSSTLQTNGFIGENAQLQQPSQQMNPKTDVYDATVIIDDGLQRVQQQQQQQLGMAQANNLYNQMNNQRVQVFLCDYCRASFPTYYEAASHEASCRYRLGQAQQQPSPAPQRNGLPQSLSDSYLNDI